MTPPSAGTFGQRHAWTLPTQELPYPDDDRGWCVGGVGGGGSESIWSEKREGGIQQGLCNGFQRFFILDIESGPLLPVTANRLI
jgi:hypothetical protein